MAGKVSEFLLEKWRQSFHFYDCNNDGVITKEDFEQMADYISEKTGASQEEAANTRHEFVKWHGLLLQDSSKPLDLDAYMNGARELFKDLNNHIKLNRTLATDFFDRMDLNKDGKINMEEFRIFYEAVGYDDRELVADIFNRLDKDGDCYLQLQEVVDDYVRYFTNPDPVDGIAYIIPSVRK